MMKIAASAENIFFIKNIFDDEIFRELIIITQKEISI